MCAVRRLRPPKTASRSAAARVVARASSSGNLVRVLGGETLGTIVSKEAADAAEVEA